MADKPVAAAVSNPQQGQGVIKRFFELLMMLVSMFLVIFAWGEVRKALMTKLRRIKLMQTKPSQDEPCPMPAFSLEIIKIPKVRLTGSIR